MDLLKKYSMYTLLSAGILLTSCKKDDDVPAVENEEEIITDVKLIFTNKVDASDIVEARAKDPDGQGVQELKIIDDINLDKNKTYILTLDIMNNLETPGEDIGIEIAEEDEEHQIFFSFSQNAFSAPSGNGNIDNASDPLVYNDTDGNGNAVGLSTTWTTNSGAITAGTFVIRLQHQPDIKTATSGANDGDTDFELGFKLNVQ